MKIQLIFLLYLLPLVSFGQRGYNDKRRQEVYNRYIEKCQYNRQYCECVINKIIETVPYSKLGSEKYKPQIKEAIEKCEYKKLTYPNPVDPPKLIAVSSIKLVDEDGDGLIEALETGEIVFKVQNKGKGNAYNLIAVATEGFYNTGLLLKRQELGDILPGETKEVRIKFDAPITLLSGTAVIYLKVEEYNNNDLIFESPITANTMRFLEPKLAIIDSKLTSELDGPLKTGERATLALLISNTGLGEAKGISLNFQVSSGISPNSPISLIKTSLQPDNKWLATFNVFIPSGYEGEKIIFKASLNEKYLKYGTEKNFEFPLKKEYEKTTIEEINTKSEIGLNEGDYILNVDVDAEVNIPVVKEKNTNKFALIIGNEEYNKRSKALTNVPYALNDARVFKKYVLNSLGVNEDQIFLIENATRNDIQNTLRSIKLLIETKDGEGELIVYYAGHGYPNSSTNEAFILPVDGNIQDFSTLFSLQDFYDQLGAMRSKKTIVFVDACFSGQARVQEVVFAQRSPIIPPKKGYLKGNIVVFAASQDNQISLPYLRNHHGLFTYFVLKSLMENKGSVDLKTLKSYVVENVVNVSIKQYNQAQKPDISASQETIGLWENWKIR
jgi:hypothetical protein